MNTFETIAMTVSHVKKLAPPADIAPASHCECAFLESKAVCALESIGNNEVMALAVTSMDAHPL